MNYTLLIPSMLLVIGWFVKNYLDYRLDVAKERRSFRIRLLRDYLDFYISASEEKSKSNFNDIQVQFLLYGYQDEIELIKKIAQKVTKQDQSFQADLKELNILTRNRLRKELNLKEIKS